MDDGVHAARHPDDGAVSRCSTAGWCAAKNVLSVLMQVMVTFSLIVVLWLIYGYSFAFTEGNAFSAVPRACSAKACSTTSLAPFANAATFSKGAW